jgi:lipoprotein NlpI
MKGVLLTASAVGLSILLLPASADDLSFDSQRWQTIAMQLTEEISNNPKAISLYSRRGDARFFLGEFEAAVSDYGKMVELDASVDASHWRRGIALFYAQQFEAAAGQFERYHSFDNVDRENGIWRYLCQVKADGVANAQGGLLKYEKDDREPFGDVYRLFAGTIEPAAIVGRIERDELSDEEREKRRFYAHLYIGLWHAVHERPQEAKPHLKRAVDNRWGPTAGYGPKYMWHVSRLHYDLLSQQPAENLKP